MIDISIFNSTGYADLLPFIQGVVALAVSLSALLTVVSIVMSGFKFMLSGGNEDKIQEATKSLTFSVLGLILVFLAPTIIEFVLSNIVGI